MNKRLSKQKAINLTAEMAENIRSYCREKKIKSQTELIRQAIVHYIDREYDDNTLKLSGLKDIRENIAEIKDMISVLFNYVNLMHLNTLSYHAEIADDYKDAAYKSAENRLDKFFVSFRERLRDDPAFFEKLLHKYVSGSLNE